MARKAVLLVSAIATALVVAGFAMFCLDELGDGSRAQLARLGGEHRPAPDAEAERERERDAGPLREAISDSNDVLLDPFAGLVATSRSAWVRHGVPALLAFLVYGLLVRLLAGYLPAPRAPAPQGWQVPR